MDKRLIALLLVIIAAAFFFGFNRSYESGIQPGYFEKAEAPAYGVGGGTKMVEGVSQEYQEYLQELYEEEE